MSFIPFCKTAEEIIAEDSAASRPLDNRCYLHYNGPGAAGFGVKRTAMLLPEAVMLLVAPGCCGRHGTITGSRTGFEDRIFYLRLEERDVVTGNYQKKIPEAAEEVCRLARPKALLLCMTCVDAILGTDLARVGRRIAEKCSCPVATCFMDPITRESKRPPMVSVQQAIFSCLPAFPKKSGCANILGNFVPLDSGCEFKKVLEQAGFTEIHQISECHTFEEYCRMGEASLNIVINPQTQAAADDLEKRCGIPNTQFRHTYGISRTLEQYSLLGTALGTELDVSSYADKAADVISDFVRKHGGLRIGVGEAVNGNPFEIALTFLEAGLEVPFVFRNIITVEDRSFLKNIAELKPDLKVYSGVHPTMTQTLSGYFDGVADIVLGLDAGYFCRDAVSVCWSMEKHPFGFDGTVRLFDALEKNLMDPIPHREQIYGSYLVV